MFSKNLLAFLMWRVKPVDARHAPTSAKLLLRHLDAPWPPLMGRALMGRAVTCWSARR